MILEHRSRRVISARVTRRPSLDWVKQQIRDACPWDGPRFLLHDNDGIFGQFGSGRRYRSALDGWLSEVIGIKGVPTPYGAPNANAVVERFMGTLKREALSHFIVTSEAHLQRVVTEFCEFYNDARPHQGIGGIPSELDLPRVLPEDGPSLRLVGRPVLGGLHHDYRLAA